MSEKKKIIDGKGKLFGKVNIIDLIVLALILVVVAIVGMKLLGRAQGFPSEGTSSELNYTVMVSRVPQNVYDAVAAEVAKGGDSATLMANGAMLEGSIVTDVSAVAHKEAVQCADGSIVLTEEPRNVDVTFQIHAVISNPVTQAVGTQEVRVGKSHIVKTKSIELVNGIILSVEPTVAP